MGKVLDIQCPSCNAPIKFDPKLGKLKCRFCDNEFDVSELKNITDVEVEESTEEVKHEENYVLYHCPDCNAEIVADENTSATFCLYCGNTAILKNKLSGEFKPDKIIPFKTVKEDAINAFKGLKKGRPFIPSSFLSEKNIEKITGLYIPFWLYQVDVSGDVCADATRVTSWTSGDRHYTKTDYYTIERDGNMVFKRVPVDGSKKFANDLMNSLEPFYFHYLVDYNHAYLSGFLAEKYDVNKEEAYLDAKKRVLTSTLDVMLNDMGAYTSKRIKNNTLTDKLEGVEYALLPVWMVNVKCNNKYYMFAMNGQTGEFIGDIPLDKKKAFLYWLGIFASVFFIIILATFIFHLMGGNI